jgi:hypothetical protein
MYRPLRGKPVLALEDVSLEVDTRGFITLPARPAAVKSTLLYLSLAASCRSRRERFQSKASLGMLDETASPREFFDTERQDYAHQVAE